MSFMISVSLVHLSLLYREHFCWFCHLYCFPEDGGLEQAVLGMAVLGVAEGSGCPSLPGPFLAGCTMGQDAWGRLQDVGQDVWGRVCTMGQMG